MPAPALLTWSSGQSIYFDVDATRPVQSTCHWNACPMVAKLKSYEALAVGHQTPEAQQLSNAAGSGLVC